MSSKGIWTAIILAMVTMSAAVTDGAVLQNKLIRLELGDSGLQAIHDKELGCHHGQTQFR